MAAFDISLSITGLQEAQAANQRAINAVKPSGALGDAVKHVTTMAQRYAIANTHVDTGALRASQRMTVSGTHGRIYLDPSAVNPRSRQRPSVYGLYEHDRGGSHAFYQRVIDEQADNLAREAMTIITEALDR